MSTATANNETNGPCAGDARALVTALTELAELEYRLGEWPSAHVTAVEALRAATLAGLEQYTIQGLIALARVEAGLGREAPCRHHVAQAIELGVRRSDRSASAAAGEIVGHLELSLGRIEAAIAELERVALACAEHPLACVTATSWPGDLADAHVRAGDRVGAWRAVKHLERRATRSGNCIAVASWARYRAALGTDERFEGLFRYALEWAKRAQQPFDLARTELCFGERLRRARRRRESREHLAAALRTFEALGSEPWVERARQELEGSVAHPRPRCHSTRDDLTPKEVQVAQIVGGGATNRETAARLFVTEKTIETHLSRIYRKLAVRSRTELARVVHTPVTRPAEPEGAGT